MAIRRGQTPKVFRDSMTRWRVILHRIALLLSLQAAGINFEKSRGAKMSRCIMGKATKSNKLHCDNNKCTNLYVYCTLYCVLHVYCCLCQVFAVSLSACCPSTDSFQNQSLASAGQEILGRVQPSVGWGPAREMKSEGPPKRKRG